MEKMLLALASVLVDWGCIFGIVCLKCFKSACMSLLKTILRDDTPMDHPQSVH